MDILLTGATGFIGKALLDDLIKKDFKLIIISRKTIPKKYFYTKNITWIKHNLSKSKINLKLKFKINTVIHLLGNHKSKNKDTLYMSNENSLINLFSSLENNFNRFIFASSHKIYGNINSILINEKSEINNNITDYAISKINSENLIHTYYKKESKKTYINLRLTGFIEGTGLIDYIINKAIKNQDILLHGNGRIYRDYLCLENCIEVINKSIKYNKKGFHIFNIGSGQIINTKKISYFIIKKLNSSSRIIASKKKNYLSNFVFNINKARKELNYKPINLLKSIENILEKK